MRRSPLRSLFTWRWPLLLALLLSPSAGHGGGLLYKDYLLRTDRGEDLLCAPYVVKPNDWVYKILKLRGEIASADFPQFLETFRRLNPEVDDINTIRPGQRILIPLRAVQREELPTASSGTVTIPFVHASGQSIQDAYIVQPGDCVSKLLAEKFGDFGSPAYRQAEVLFQQLNPRVRDLNRIYPGQKLILRDLLAGKATMPASAENGVSKPEPVSDRPGPPDSDLSRLAELLDARVRSRGRYFFPRSGGSDVVLDLARHPLLELADGSRLLVAGDTPPDASVLTAARRHWPRLTVVATSAEAPVQDQLEIWMAALADRQTDGPLTFIDGGIEVTIRTPWVLRLTPALAKVPRYLCITPVASDEERTPEPVQRYLDAHGIKLKEVLRAPAGTPKPAVVVGQVPGRFGTPLPRVVGYDSARQFVADLLPATGFAYAEKVKVTFPYAGLQIQTFANVVHPPRGAPLFIDFGDLYGEALNAIQATGFRILSISRDLPPDEIVEKVLTALEAPFERHPVFLAAARSKDNNIELRIPGVLRLPTAESGGHLITSAEIDERLRRFLAQRRIGVLSYGYTAAAVAHPATANR